MVVPLLGHKKTLGVFSMRGTVVRSGGRPCVRHMDLSLKHHTVKKMLCLHTRYLEATDPAYTCGRAQL